MKYTKKDLRLLDGAKQNIKLIEKRHPFTQHYTEDFYWQFDDFRELLVDLVKDKVNGTDIVSAPTPSKTTEKSPLSNTQNKLNYGNRRP